MAPWAQAVSWDFSLQPAESFLTQKIQAIATSVMNRIGVFRMFFNKICSLVGYLISGNSTYGGGGESDLLQQGNKVT